MAKDAGKGDKDAKAQKGKAQKGKGKDAGDAGSGEDERRVRLTAHPRARAQIARAKGWGGLLGFALAIVLSLHAHVPAWEAGLRGLAGGIVLYLAGWAVAQTVWRQLAVAEVERVRRGLQQGAAEAVEAEVVTAK